MNHIQSFFMEEDGIETVEVVLIMVILVALVLVFKGKISDIVTKTLEKIGSDAGKIGGIS